MIVVPGQDVEDAAELAEREKVSIVYGSSTFFQRFLSRINDVSKFTSTLRLAKAGAMPVSEDLRERWENATGLSLTLGYGLTEASPETHDSLPGKTRPGTIGVPCLILKRASWMMKTVPGCCRRAKWENCSSGALR